MDDFDDFFDDLGDMGEINATVIDEESKSVNQVVRRMEILDRTDVCPNCKKEMVIDDIRKYCTDCGITQESQNISVNSEAISHVHTGKNSSASKLKTSTRTRQGPRFIINAVKQSIQTPQKDLDVIIELLKSGKLLKEDQMERVIPIVTSQVDKILRQSAYVARHENNQAVVAQMFMSICSYYKYSIAPTDLIRVLGIKKSQLNRGKQLIIAFTQRGVIDQKFFDGKKNLIPTAMKYIDNIIGQIGSVKDDPKLVLLRKIVSDLLTALDISKALLQYSHEDRTVVAIVLWYCCEHVSKYNCYTMNATAFSRCIDVKIGLNNNSLKRDLNSNDRIREIVFTVWRHNGLIHHNSDEGKNIIRRRRGHLLR